MPDFTVIEGGGKGRGDYHEGWSRHHFERLIIELLRSVARGHDSEMRVQRELVELIKHLSKTESPLQQIIHNTLQEAHQNTVAFEPSERSEFEHDLRSILKSALQTAAESMCDDAGARGRRSRRTHELLDAIRQLNENRRRQYQRPPS